MEKIHLVLFLAFWSASVISQTQACSTPPVVDNAFISENEKIGNYSEGDIVYYTCHPGYISRGRLRYKCQDEEWTQSRLLKCTPKPCGHPGDIINGRFHLVNNTEFLYGVQVKYTCNEGYQMASQMDFRVCLDNGWSNDVPHCEVKTCIPQKPEAGIIITSGKFESDEPIPYGNVLKFECSSSDFTIDGESEVHCKADGNWSSPFPTCKELKCPSPPNILHGRLVEASENEYAHDRRVKYQCDQFYQIQGSTFIRCIHGTWSIPPSCIDYFINTADVLSGNASREKTPAVTYPTLTGFCPDVITDTLHGLKKCNPVIGVPVIYLPSTGEELLNWVEEGGVWWKKM